MHNLPNELANRLKQEGEAVLAYLYPLMPEQWEQEVYAPGQEGAEAWRVRDILAHLIAAEQGFQKLIANVAAAGQGVTPDFDIDAYNQRTVGELRPLEPGVLISQFAMTRERTVIIVSALTPEQLALIGRHPAAGEVTLSEIIRLIYNHNKLHLRDMRLALRSGRPIMPATGSQLQSGAGR
jgi:hypothetical protein